MSGAPDGPRMCLGAACWTAWLFSAMALCCMQCLFACTHIREHLHCADPTACKQQTVQSGRTFEFTVLNTVYSQRWRTTCVFELNLQVLRIDRPNRNASQTIVHNVNYRSATIGWRFECGEPAPERFQFARVWHLMFRCVPLDFRVHLVCFSYVSHMLLSWSPRSSSVLSCFFSPVLSCDFKNFL